MNNTSTVGVSFKVDKALRDNFKAACEKDGYSSSLVHRKLMEQYVKSKAVTRAANEPNEQTIAAIENIEAGRNIKKFNNVDELFSDLGI